ncbi:MAG: tyrosine--tRNA ligase [Dehalococcoidia bacterium]|nr:tyrosine--tRNA ligase [Dehalococcoidia bacterium]
MSRRMAPVDEQLFVLMNGVEYGDGGLRRAFEAELRELLEEDRPLRVYLGIDPTATSLTLGHAVPLRKLRQFQDFGHETVFLIGDITALIGDPSDKNKLRPQIDSETIQANEAAYFAQASKILDQEKTVVRHNSEWLGDLDLSDLISLMSKFTVAEMLTRDNFRQRYQSEDAVYLHEFLYALLQGYDALALECDVQVGGTEQLFNLMAGRKLQEQAGQRKHVPVTMPILVGIDGSMRMSKSTGNFIGLDEAPEEQYGKAMSIPDGALANYFQLATNLDRNDVVATIEGLANNERDPMTEKKRLARTIVTELHGEEAAARAEAHFERTVQRREEPEEMPEAPAGEGQALIDVIVEAGAAPSRREARRLFEQGAVTVDGAPAGDGREPARIGSRVRVGKRRWLRITAAGD